MIICKTYVIFDSLLRIISRDEFAYISHTCRRYEAVPSHRYVVYMLWNLLCVMWCQVEYSLSHSIHVDSRLNGSMAWGWGGQPRRNISKFSNAKTFVNFCAKLKQINDRRKQNSDNVNSYLGQSNIRVAECLYDFHVTRGNILHGRLRNYLNGFW